MDLKDDLEEIKDQFLLTVKSITSGKDVWVKEVMSLERDPIAEFTNGKQSLVRFLGIFPQNKLKDFAL